MASKTQPEEHEVLSEIEKVLSSNPDFGSKRVAVEIKEQNPEWSLSDKRVTKLLKKHKSTKINDGNDSDSNSTSDNDSPSAAAPPAASPWNVTPAPAHDPWNNTFTVDSGAKAAAPPVIAPAFNLEPNSEPAPAAHNPWNAAPTHDKSFTETVSGNVSKAVKSTQGFVEQTATKAKDVAHKAKDKAEDVADDVKDAAKDAKKSGSGFFDKVKDMAEDAVDAVQDATEDAVKKIKDTTEDAVDALKHKADDASDAIKEKSESNPSPWNAPVTDDKTSESIMNTVKSATHSVSATATAGVAAIKHAVADNKTQSAWNASPVETPAIVTKPAAPVIETHKAPAAEAPKKEAWNFDSEKKDVKKVEKELSESAKKAEKKAESALEKLEDAAHDAATKVKEEAAAAVVVLKKAESAVEDKLAEAKKAASNLVDAGYTSASVATTDKNSKQAKNRPAAEKDVEGSACGACQCVVM